MPLRTGPGDAAFTAGGSGCKGTPDTGSRLLVETQGHVPHCVEAEGH